MYSDDNTDSDVHLSASAQEYVTASEQLDLRDGSISRLTLGSTQTLQW